MSGETESLEAAHAEVLRRHIDQTGAKPVAYGNRYTITRAPDGKLWAAYWYLNWHERVVVSEVVQAETKRLLKEGHGTRP
jgi:hypothetical protein